MGVILSYLWWGGCDPDEVNSESGLSKRDIHQVRTSWAKVTKDAVGSGTELLIRYFTKYPEYKKHFKSFKDQPTEDLRSNRQFHAHSLAIISSLSSVIDNLDKPDLATVICQKLGESHADRRITETQFNELKDILVNLFIQDLKFDDATMGSWVKTVGFIYNNIFQAMTEATK